MSANPAAHLVAANTRLFLVTRLPVRLEDGLLKSNSRTLQPKVQHNAVLTDVVVLALQSLPKRHQRPPRVRQHVPWREAWGCQESRGRSSVSSASSASCFVAFSSMRR